MDKSKYIAVTAIMNNRALLNDMDFEITENECSERYVIEIVTSEKCKN